MARQANAEQDKAINNFEGVILSAGAGSGKTFVIVEHLVKIIENFSKNKSSEQLKEIIPLNLSKIVLMTFTKKASGEMLVRLIKRLEEKSVEDSSIVWSLALLNVNLIQISTIHGFCHKLISSGIWSNYPSEIDLLDDLAHFEKINKIFDRWLLINQNNIGEVFLAHTTDLLVGMLEIFKSPELRILWEKGIKVNSAKDELDEFFNDYLNLKKFKFIFNPSVVVTQEPDKIKKQGFKLNFDFQQLSIKLGPISGKNYREYFNYFSTINRFPSTTKDMEEIDTDYRLEVKDIFDLYKDVNEDFEFFNENFQAFQDWENKLVSLFDYINSNYLEDNGMSFSDLEYYVFKGLSDKLAASKLAERFNYFIVDEFQDTSSIQFEILRKCLGENFQNLFCVGDKKQAIYGFRGGELKVFEECNLLMKPNSRLFLATNYRSKRKVVEFNNKFFTNLLPLGGGFKGEDPHTVAMEPQTLPSESTGGEVVRYVTNVINETSLDSDYEIDLIESEAILKVLESQLQNPEYEDIAILYKKLSPSIYLIDRLRESGISFSAQVKILVDDDPIISIFQTLLKIYLNRNDLKKKESGLLLLGSYLEILGVKAFELEMVEKFINNLPILGLEITFSKTLFELNISNSLFVHNQNLINSIINLGEGDPLRVLNILSEQETDYSFEMINGRKKKIHILTIHNSKGLEYDSVILGGIHKNGRFHGIKNKVGKYPKSFKWKFRFDQKNYIKSPAYYIESEIETQKDFSESKRLLYVACTRAVKKLSHIDVRFKGSEKSFYSNSWINAFRAIELPEMKEEQLELVIPEMQPVDINIAQKDNMGIVISEKKTELGITSELSVTRLASLVQCPFKFYLKNICKLEPEVNIDFDKDDNEFFSSKKRGTDLHYQISANLNQDKLVNVQDEDAKVIINWVNAEFLKLKPEIFSSEIEMKFSFFGQMITAIPDLILVKNNQIEVWDFKTGLRNENNEESYWFQLACYAYGHGVLNNLDQEISFNLKLLYLDQKDIVSKTLKLKEINEYLFKTWKKIENLYQVNLNHCGFCEYKSMCKSACSVATI
jgi:ATP-dependent exoDNAse (exonuclease V) beta subunit